MAFQPNEGSEPIPGYRLVQRLGAGGFGEVWKVTAPGGLTKALKVVYGRMEESRADRELKALERVKVVRHPFVLSLERVEIIDNQLLIVTELADMSLFDRFNQCRAEGLRGIPREELLGHLHDAADGLDYLREHHDLQHLDIKPHNLLIVGGRIKVADFGQVKGLTGTSVTATGGATPVYAPPEVFDGRVSRQSDQYSLAIVYQELLTGQRPFPGLTTLQLAAQHTNSPPLLEPLPVRDRPLIARALAKLPEARFASCREMVAALIAASSTPGPLAAAPSPVTLTPVTAARPTVVETPDDALDSPTQVGAPPHRPLTFTPATLLGGKTVCPATTVFVGVGGLAGRVLRQLRRPGNAPNTPAARLLLLDTDRAALNQRTAAEGETLAPEKYLHLPLHRPEDYRERAPQLLQWMDRRWLYGIPRSLLTEGVRALGRLALVDNSAELLPRLRTLLAAPEGAPADPVWVVLVASSGGGTGSGMVLDLGYLLRRVLAEANRPVAGIDAVLLHATGLKPAARDLARVNTVACLRELSHFARPDMAYPGDASLGLRPAALGEPPFSGCVLIHLGDELDDRRLTAAADNVAEYLQVAISNPILRPSASGPWPVQGAALTRISFPRARVARRAVSLYCADLVHRWSGKAAPPPEMKTPERSVEETPSTPKTEVRLPNWESELQMDRLVRHFYDEARTAMGDELAERYRGLQTNPPLPTQQFVAQFLMRVEDYLGAGAAPDDGVGPATTSFTQTIRDRATEGAAELVSRLSAWLVRCTEDPTGRLLLAERSGRAIADRVAVSIEAVRTRLVQVRTRRMALRSYLLGRASRPGKKDSSVAWLAARLTPGSSGGPDDELGSAIAVRLEEIALDNAFVVLNEVLQRVREAGQDLGLCRQALNRLGDSFLAESGRQETLAAPPLLTEVYPGGAADATAAARVLLRGLPAGAVAQFEADLRTEWLDPRGGLWDVVSKGGDLQELRHELSERAAKALTEVLAGVDACRCLPEAGEAADELLRTHARAATPPVTAGGGEELILGVPSGDAGLRVRDRILQLLERPTGVTVLTDGDLLIFRYAPCPTPDETAAVLTANDTALTELSRQVWTRLDVPWSF